MCSDALTDCFNNCIFPECKCNTFYYQYQNGGCVHYDQVCDSIPHCSDGDDERQCHKEKLFPKFDASFLKASYIVGLCDPPTENLLACRTKLQCYDFSAICHYDHSGGPMAHCEDGSHLGWGSVCRYTECIHTYKCQGSYCIPTRKICDGIIDCPVGDDERNCSSMKCSNVSDGTCMEFSCPGHLQCSGVMFCVPPHEICDDISHCPRQDDEKYCQPCPEDCQCKGTAIFCENIRNLSLSAHLYSPSALVLYNSYHISTEFYDKYFDKMKYVRLVDLKYNSFTSLLEQSPII